MNFHLHPSPFILGWMARYKVILAYDGTDFQGFQQAKSYCAISCQLLWLSWMEGRRACSWEDRYRCHVGRVIIFDELDALNRITVGDKCLSPPDVVVDHFMVSVIFTHVLPPKPSVSILLILR
jgi:hypothetical protein